MNIKELIINKTAKFVYCTDGALWYDVDGFRFPVPFEETVGAYFKPEHKAINLMRWIRKQLEENDEQRKAQSKVR
ncbi:MAG: hypothetical protein JETCAE01_31770 [Anaerolineaceae bacterium]|nr:MAG: hypothetical protein JETCAE01_31770 [Anaerolineaceae bacterium]